jgi:hypothetical protein
LYFDRIGRNRKKLASPNLGARDDATDSRSDPG